MAVAGWLSKVDQRASVLVGLVVLFGALVLAGGAVRLVQGFVDRKNDDLALARWVTDQSDPRGQLLSFGPTLTLRHYTRVPTYDLFDLSPSDVSNVLGHAVPTYVLVDEANIADQWAGQAPATNLQRLETDPGLVSIGTFGPYTLLRADGT
jgi:hypothetical protein